MTGAPSAPEPESADPVLTRLVETAQWIDPSLVAPSLEALLAGTEFADALAAAPTGPEPLTEEVVAALPEGTPVTVIWSGGNGPHDYVIAVDKHGSRYVWNCTEERLRWYNPLRFVGQERYHTRVWLTPTGPEPRTDAAVGR